jgi:SlyX protein
MNPDERLDHRLTDLEIKLSFTEDLVERLNEVVVRQQDQIDRLVQEVVRLRDQSPAPDTGAPRNLLDERPPHY